EAFPLPAEQGRRDHVGFQMADRAGDDLLDNRPTTSQFAGIVVGCQIADQRGDPVTAPERPEHFLQKRSLAGAWARHQADDVRACPMEPLPKGACSAIVVLQNVLSNLNQTRMFAHGSISTVGYARPSMRGKRRKGCHVLRILRYLLTSCPT